MVPGVPVIYDGNDPDAAGVMREHAEKLGCPYYELKQGDTEIHKIPKDGIRFSLKDETYGDTVFDIPFIARYQVMNAALAVKNHSGTGRSDSGISGGSEGWYGKNTLAGKDGNGSSGGDRGWRT